MTSSSLALFIYSEKFSLRVGFTRSFLWGNRFHLPYIGLRIGKLDKINFSVNKINEVEGNLNEIKNLQIEDGKRYEQLGNIWLILVKKNLVTCLSIKLRDRVISLNKYKNLSSDASSNSEFGFLENDVLSL